MSCSKLKIIHIIHSLKMGGAEMMLYRLLSQTNRDKFEIQVIVLTEIGLIGEKLKKLNIPLHTLNLVSPIRLPLSFLTLLKIVREIKPNIVQSWMYHSDFFASILKIFCPKLKVVWGIHTTELDNKLTQILRMILSRLSFFLPDKIICVSKESMKLHIRIGYCPNKIKIIHNGFDIEKFSPNEITRTKKRTELNIEENVNFIIGSIGRFHPQKDYDTLIHAAKYLTQKTENILFILCGLNLDCNNDQLMKQINKNQLTPYFKLLGIRTDIPQLINAFDTLCLSSICEAFPIVIGEAMATGVPCVATDVGDSSKLIGETGKIVPPKSPHKLANAIYDIIKMSKTEKIELGQNARNRIIEFYSLEKIARQYNELYKKLSD